MIVYRMCCCNHLYAIAIDAIIPANGMRTNEIRNEIDKERLSQWSNFFCTGTASGHIPDDHLSISSRLFGVRDKT